MGPARRCRGRSRRKRSPVCWIQSLDWVSPFAGTWCQPARTSWTLRSAGQFQPTVQVCCLIYSPPMSYSVDFVNVSTVGLESSPVAAALAGLRANEARYFKNKYDHIFTVEPAAKAKKAIDWVHRILKEERGHRHRLASARGNDVRGREHPMDLRLLRERALDQRPVHARRRSRSGRSASSSPKGWTSPPNWARSSSRARSRSWRGRSAARTS